jgi:hypothetical protein
LDAGSLAQSARFQIRLDYLAAAAALHLAASTHATLRCLLQTSVRLQIAALGVPIKIPRNFGCKAAHQRQ